MFTEAELRAEREQLLTRAREIIAVADADGRDLSEDEDVAYREAVDAAGALKTRIDRARVLGTIARAAQNSANLEGGSFGAPQVMTRSNPYDNLEHVRSNMVQPEQIRGRALAAVDQAESWQVDDAGREHVHTLLEGRRDNQATAIARHMLLTGSQQYHDEFNEYIESHGQYMGPAVRAALALSPNTAGGALVPFTLDPTIILTNAGIVDPIRSISHVEQIATNSWNGITSAGVTAAFVAENAVISDATPAVAPKAIPVYKAAAWVFGSWEILGDSNFGTQLPRLIADAKARLEGGKFAVGSGSGEPTGVVTAVKAQTTSRVAAGTAGAFGVADVFAVSNAMEPRYSQNASWLGNKSVYNVIRQFSTVTSGGAFWTDLGMGRPANLIGASTYEASSMAAYSTATNTDLLLAADMSMFYIIDRVGLSLTFDQNIYDTTTGRPLGQSGWVAWWRVGSDMTDPGAGRLVRPFTTTSNWV